MAEDDTSPDATATVYEERAEQARDRIADTVDQLQAKLSPRNIVREAMGSFSSGGQRVVGDAGEWANASLVDARRWFDQNRGAVVVGGIAVGAVMLLARAGRKDRAHDELYSDQDIYAGYGEYHEDDAMTDQYRGSQSYDASADTAYGERSSIPGAGATGGRMNIAKERAEAIGDKASAAAAQATAYARDTYATARERGGEYYEQARMKGGELVDRARVQAVRAQAVAEREFADNPMTAVVLGFAVGAAIGALLPRTRVENEQMGAASDRLSEQAKHAAKVAADAGKDKLEEMGITAEGAKAKLAEVAEQAKMVAKDVGQTAVASAKADIAPASGGASMTSAYGSAPVPPSIG